MKQSTLLLSFAFAFLMLLSVNVSAQEFSELDKSPMDVASYPTDYKNADKLIKIVYSRPQLKERALSKLAPNGEVWRTGANEATELTLYKTMKLGDTALEAGTYIFYAIPGEKEWTVIVSSDLNVWGSYFYNEKNDVARLAVPVATGSKSLEAFSIAFDDADDGVDMHMGWGKTRVVVPFTK